MIVSKLPVWHVLTTITLFICSRKEIVKLELSLITLGVLLSMALSVLMLLCLTFRLREPEPEPPGRRYRGRL